MTLRGDVAGVIVEGFEGGVARVLHGVLNVVLQGVLKGLLHCVTI